MVLKLITNRQFYETTNNSCFKCLHFCCLQQCTRPNGWGVKTKGELYVGPNIMGRLLMELRDTGKMDYHLSDDYFEFHKTLLNPTV